MPAPFWTRLTAAATAAWSAFNEKSYTAIDRLGWDTYASRLNRYYFHEHYYHNTIYSALETHAAQHKHSRKLYTHIRPIYNPVERLVELYVSKVYGGSLDMDDLMSGAIPIVTSNNRMREALVRLYRDSDWGVQKAIYVRWGAMLGDSVIKIVDDREAQEVRLEPLHPSKLREVRYNTRGEPIYGLIQYPRNEEPAVNLFNASAIVKTYTYTEEITETEFVTYKDNEEFAYYKDAAGNPVSRWPNQYGFVPLVVAKHRDMGLQWGACSFASASRKIDELNDAASVTNDQIRKLVNAIWYMAGVDAQDEIISPTEDRDDLAMIYGPENSQPFPMAANVPVDAAIKNIDAILQEIERDMPELSLHRIRATGQATAPGVKAAYGDAVDRITEAAGSYDSALVKAHKMALAIGGFNGYKDYETFGLESRVSGDLDHTIKEREIIPDKLTTFERVDKLIATGAPPQAVWQVMGVSDDQIREWTALKETQQIEVEARQERQIEAMAERDRGLSGGQRRPGLPAGVAANAN